MFMRRFMQLATLAILVVAVGCAHTTATNSDVKRAQSEAAAAAEKKDQAAKEEDRQKILAMKDIALADLYKRNPKAKEEIEKTAGYAVFDASGVYVVLYVGVAGRGVLIDNSNGEATYMTMARAGTGPGIGYERFRYVIVFKSKKLLDTFKTVGGDIGASGHFVAKGFDMGGSVGAQVSFDPELSVYQLTESGLAAEASWGATAYVPDPFLNPPKQASVDETRAIAEEGYIYGLPIVMNYAVMYDYAVDRNSGQFKAPFNQIHNETRVFTYKDTAIVTPNSDTPYSMLWMDLRAEPIVLSVPAVEKSRYYSVQLIDGNTYNYGYIGSRATGSEAGDYMVVGPDWKGETPPGIKNVFHSGTQFSAAAYRTQLFNADDMDNVRKVQAGYKVQTLSAYLKQPAPAQAPAVTFLKIDKELARTNFFEYLDFALLFAPAGPDEHGIRGKLTRIGIGPGKTFDFKELTPAHKEEIGLGMKDGAAKVEQTASHLGRNINGWQVGSTFGDRTFFNGDWLLRAAAAKAGIYGNDAVEAMYPMTREDAAGQPLDGSKANYTLTFPAGQLPPVNAFWSVTMYDGRTQLLIENPINRYLINSPMLPSMKQNPDGSLTIYIRKDTPGKDRESNWLPAPNGPIYMVMRLYWPKTTPPSILPPGSGTWNPPGVVRTQ